MVNRFPIKIVIKKGLLYIVMSSALTIILYNIALYFSKKQSTKKIKGNDPKPYKYLHYEYFNKTTSHLDNEKIHNESEKSEYFSCQETFDSEMDQRNLDELDVTTFEFRCFDTDDGGLIRNKKDRISEESDEWFSAKEEISGENIDPITDSQKIKHVYSKKTNSNTKLSERYYKKELDIESEDIFYSCIDEESKIKTFEKNKEKIKYEDKKKNLIKTHVEYKSYPESENQDFYSIQNEEDFFSCEDNSKDKYNFQVIIDDKVSDKEEFYSCEENEDKSKSQTILEEQVNEDEEFHSNKEENEDKSKSQTILEEEVNDKEEFYSCEENEDKSKSQAKLEEQVSDKEEFYSCKDKNEDKSKSQVNINDEVNEEFFSCDNKLDGINTDVKSESVKSYLDIESNCEVDLQSNRSSSIQSKNKDNELNKNDREEKKIQNDLKNVKNFNNESEDVFHSCQSNLLLNINDQIETDITKTNQEHNSVDFKHCDLLNQKIENNSECSNLDDFISCENAESTDKIANVKIEITRIVETKDNQMNSNAKYKSNTPSTINMRNVCEEIISLIKKNENKVDLNLPNPNPDSTTIQKSIFTNLTDSFLTELVQFFQDYEKSIFIENENEMNIFNKYIIPITNENVNKEKFNDMLHFKDEITNEIKSTMHKILNQKEIQKFIDTQITRTLINNNIHFLSWSNLDSHKNTVYKPINLDQENFFMIIQPVLENLMVRFNKTLKNYLLNQILECVLPEKIDIAKYNNLLIHLVKNLIDCEISIENVDHSYQSDFPYEIEKLILSSLQFVFTELTSAYFRNFFQVYIVWVRHPK